MYNPDNKIGKFPRILFPKVLKSHKLPQNTNSVM